MVAEPEQARILVVSASPYTRYVISGELSSEPDLFVVGTARTPEEITYKQALLRPELAVVDLESPRDLANLQLTTTEIELPALAVCSNTGDGPELAFTALETGAADVIARSVNSLGVVNFAPDLLRKVRGLARILPRPVAWHWPSLAPRSKMPLRHFLPGDHVVAISASMGGLGPLVQILTTLPARLKASLLVLSSLPDCYLPWLLRHVDPATSFHLRPAQDGLPLHSGAAYFPHSDHHLIVGARGYLILDQGPRRNGVRPSADVTLSSLAIRYGPAVIGVILSGIGRDGVRGTLDVCAASGSVIVQETTSCLADETPAAVIEAGAAAEVLPPAQIAEGIVRLSARESPG